ncbi:retroviral-like aspartic protease family protein [Gluconobacter japonicus]|uniref:Aspartyl protease n=1 Tax=Gluconobacter japonicus TaxID=376620 RepID=A0ABQ5WI08_GLUJA|nr:retroviral-like aspartic protease family protein [Gluconobacter japonicus]KXV27074.1 hypothetical protein AD938_07735 [Gluconobacter japonicus]GBR25880.1 hypothetical protein AA3271_2147 [Gluconobacter japonicus NBRC 3271]GLQ59176.1 hypothetical protein GCM10010937_09790 [Gluconobacter japonicus]
MKRLIGGFLTSLLAVTGYANAGTCRMTQATVLPLRNDGGYLSVPVQINGQAASMIVDTGSQGSLMTPEGIRTLRLPQDQNRHTVMQGPNGAPRLVPNSRIADLRLGKLALGAGSMPVGSLPGSPMIRPPILGLLGADVLDGYDLEFDVPHQQLIFWKILPSSSDCQLAPSWKGKWNTVPARVIDGRMMVTFTLDGTHGTALLDSGARSHIISTDFAYRLGLTDELLALDPGGTTAGVDLHERRYHWHHFKRFSMGGTVWENPVLTVAPVHDQTDMLLGSDWFAKHDIWLSYATSQIFVR